jgi:hypothetical protein
VFFNSSKEITEMRAYLSAQRWCTLRYWIGVVIMIDICVTILALVVTYTLSKLIASISDSNAHAMLRSSIGSYVAVLPSRFTVAALYLFLLWIAMFIWEIFEGPIHYLLMLMVLTLFFHVIIPLSAFGRLIIHTGAMGARPVLDVELEKELLPSGLHNSLLIRAMDRKRKYQSSTDQYRKPSRPSHPLGSFISSVYETSQASSHSPPRNIVVSGRYEVDDSSIDGDEEEVLDGLLTQYQTKADPESLTRGSEGGDSNARGAHHRRVQTMDTVSAEVTNDINSSTDIGDTSLKRVIPTLGWV